jgi:N-ethylmaleimide reductase
MAPTSVVEAVRPQQAVAELLFQPYRLGPFTLPHRIVMAPLTRSRARQPGNVPTSLNACYYAQRASAAFIISEATQVSMQGQGYAWTPGIHSREQVEGWRLVTDAVHAAGGLPAALACRTHLTSGTAAGSHAAGRPLGHYPGRRRVHRE